MNTSEETRVATFIQGSGESIIIDHVGGRAAASKYRLRVNRPQGHTDFELSDHALRCLSRQLAEYTAKCVARTCPARSPGPGARRHPAWWRSEP